MQPIQKVLIKMFALRLFMMLYYLTLISICLYVYTVTPTMWLIIGALGNVPLFGFSLYNTVKTASGYIKYHEDIKAAIKVQNKKWKK